MNRTLKGCLIGCGVFAALTVVVVVVAVGWLRNTFAGPKPPDPVVAKNTALRPTFILNGREPLQAGTAVLARTRPGAQPVMLTALHLLGEAGGLEEEVSPAKIDAVVREVRLRPIQGGAPVALARGGVRKTGAALSGENTDVSQDLAAFRVTRNAGATVLDLATSNPRMGEWVWLVGDEISHKPQTQRLFPARVTIVTDQVGVLNFERAFELQAFSGAPLVNAKKQVVGLLIGGDGDRTGTFNPVAGIRKRLVESGVR